MNDGRRLVREHLVDEGVLQKNWAALVLAACDGRDYLETLLRDGKATAPQATTADTTRSAAAYLASITVQAFAASARA